MAIPQRGINVKVAMRYLLSKLLLSEEAELPFEYGTDPGHFGGGSENMKLLYAVCGYVGRATQGRERLIEWYASEKGHGGGEPLTVTHAQLHLGGHAAAALNSFDRADSELLELARDWLRVEYSLLTACEVDGEPWTPGARSVLRGQVVAENSVRGKFVAAVRRGRVRGRRNQYDLGPWCVVDLPAGVRRKIASPPQKLPAMQGGLEINRFEDGRFWASFASLPLRGGGVRAAGFDGSEKWVEREGAQDRIAEYPGSPTLEIAPPTYRRARRTIP